MSKYYDWDKTLSYDARIYMIVGAKGIGKTYGIRKKLLSWFDKRGERFLEVYRTQEERKNGMDEWAAKLLSGNDAPTGYAYESKRRRLVRHRTDEEGNKIKGAPDETCGYFVAMSELQSAKRGTYDSNTNNVLVDEAIIDRQLDRSHRYRAGEWQLLAKVVNSVLREEQGDERRTRLFLLANAVDLVNPYFQAAGITHVPDFGYHWALDKHMLIHYVPDDQSYASNKIDSLSAIMMGAKTHERMGLDGEFVDGKNKFVLPRRPKLTRYLFGMRFNGQTWGVWECTDGYVFIDTRAVDNVRCFALTAEDGSPSLVQARRATPHLKMMGELYYAGQLRYESESVRRGFLRAMASFGVR